MVPKKSTMVMNNKDQPLETFEPLEKEGHSMHVSKHASSEVTMENGGLEEGEIETLHEDMYLETHPLHTCWTMYYTQPGKTKEWKDAVHKVSTVNTVEDFWGLHECLPPVNQIMGGSDYNFFREDIFPAWEDPRNKQGGRWNYSCSHLSPSIWLNSCLFLIGEMFEDSQEICGLVISIRKGMRASLWTKTAADKDKTIKLGYF
ncbi:Eukaryotic translation initiation factor 4E type 2 [Coelomomyces lativittatus]|nr:Eukaryotic translation initiation factor 4E type 2 [Coelomomyces lativittatus]